MIGCNIGEAAVAAIGFLLGWDMTSTIMLALSLAFAVGYAFTIVPMLKGMPLRQAAKITVIGDIATIVAMETVKISLALLIPGFMHAGLTDATFWLGLGMILPAGYVVAYPTMYWAMRREQKELMWQLHHH